MPLLTKFLASKSVTIILLLASSGGGWFLYNRITHIGALEIANKQYEQELIDIKARNKAYDEFDRLLSANTQNINMQYSAIRGDIEKLAKDNEKLKIYLNAKPTADYIARLCRSGFYTQQVCEQHTGKVSN